MFMELEENHVTGVVRRILHTIKGDLVQLSVKLNNNLKCLSFLPYNNPTTRRVYSLDMINWNTK